MEQASSCQRQGRDGSSGGRSAGVLGTGNDNDRASQPAWSGGVIYSNDERLFRAFYITTRPEGRGIERKPWRRARASRQQQA